MQNPLIVSTAAYDGYSFDEVFTSLKGLGVTCVELAFIGGYTEHWKLFLGLVLLIVVLYANGGLMKIVVGEKHHD